MSKYNTAFLLLVYLLVTSCGKEFLEVKQNQNLVVPYRIADFQGMLDQVSIMNTSSCHELSTIGSDEYFIAENVWSALTNTDQKNGYIWAADIFERGRSDDWERAYNRMLIANMALEVEKIKPNANEQDAWNNVVGSALFFRALNHFQLAQLFCKPYNAESASADLGIPLRLEADVTIKSTRASVFETYAQMILDLERARDLLPDKPLLKYRPSKAAVFALLSKVYLQMDEYEKAELNASKCLAIDDELIDFNTLDIDARYPMTQNYEENPEIVFMCNINNLAITNTSRFNVDTLLWAMYEEDDLRKQVYFFETGGRRVFKGSYRGSAAFFTGMALDEVLLNRAECSVRLGNLNMALNDLNRLLSHRYKKEGFSPLDIGDSDLLLRRILHERRKELLMRGTRWEDLRRLNRDERFATILERKLGDRYYELKPTAQRYVLPIPDNEIDLSGIEQNPR